VDADDDGEPAVPESLWPGLDAPGHVSKHDDVFERVKPAQQHANDDDFPVPTGPERGEQTVKPVLTVACKMNQVSSGPQPEEIIHYKLATE